jgi:hypothetical protein
MFLAVDCDHHLLSGLVDDDHNIRTRRLRENKRDKRCGEGGARRWRRMRLLQSDLLFLKLSTPEPSNRADHTIFMKAGRQKMAASARPNLGWSQMPARPRPKIQYR